MLATCLAFFETTVKALSRLCALMSMFNVTTVLDNNVIVHEDVWLTASVVHVFVVIVVVVTNQTRVRLSRVRAEICR